MTHPTHEFHGEPPTVSEQGIFSPQTSLEIGKYRIISELGRGGFGVVYLGHDDRLDRPVAIKVPHPQHVTTPAQIDSCLNEARTVARLEHPHIVSVFDVDSTRDFPCIIVSRFIDGTNLATRMSLKPPTLTESVELVATVADALHFAHSRGVFHRDVKPPNLLISQDGTPFICDFGVALRERDVGHGPRYVGTPAYMSPEQARGEGHRVDGRSDIFSLGVVLYELLTGRRPFQGDSQDELMTAITNTEPRPLRQIRDSIPRELERICLRALAKRVTERYMTASDFSEDLLQFLADSPRSLLSAPQIVSQSSSPTPSYKPIQSAPSDTRPVTVVPKGLRAFDGTDADFFLSLLPGPRDREGLPDSLRFWKRWAETADTGVGLLYGPSGCGKTSLVRAGLLPRLSSSILPVYLQATPEGIEDRLLAALRKQLPDLPEMGFAETLTALRLGRFVPAGRSVLLVIDQFEQWLHAHPKLETESGALQELIRGLRQCDGERIRCVLMVRDDFWLAVSRFMRALEVRIEEDRNARLVDLFDLPHARKVLIAFGQAYGCLPEGPKSLTPEHQLFIDRAVQGLSDGETVVSVRLALFAQMVKGLEWGPTTLDRIGGAQGVGVAFLEASFTGSSAPLTNRMHGNAARAILAALLPDGGAGIKGAMRPEAELLEVSGYANNPDDFAETLRILDADLRLITPADTVNTDGNTSVGQRQYQLTHDYLVPSLHEWLTRKQRETRRGRAELLLEERTKEWSARPDTRWLPSLGEWLAIRLRTTKRTWTDSQRRMLRAAGRHHGKRVGGWALLILLSCGLLFSGSMMLLARAKADALYSRLLGSSIAELPGILDELESKRPRLQERLLAERATTTDPQRLLRLSLALLPTDPGEVELNFLWERLLVAPQDEFVLLRDRLRARASSMIPGLWKQTSDQNLDPGKRFRAAVALATYDPKNPAWASEARPTADRLLVQMATEVPTWTALLQPVRSHLLQPIAERIIDPQGSPLVAKTAVSVFRDLAMPSDYSILEQVATLDTDALAAVVGTGSLREFPEDLLRRRANAAAALIASQQGAKVWRLLVHTSDPTLRTLLIERLAAIETDPAILMTRLRVEPDVTVRRALILALGSYPAAYPIPDEKYLLELFEKDPDAGIHGASEWATRRRQRESELGAIIDSWVQNRGVRKGNWFVNERGMTFTQLEPQTLTHTGRNGLRKVDIPYSFAICTKEVTQRQWDEVMRKSPLTDPQLANLPVGGLDFYEMAEFCNKLSELEGIPETQWCYEPNKQGRYAEGMGVRDPQTHSGYRLPTGYEWELAARWKATTSWHCGEVDDAVLLSYARFRQNSPDLLRSPTKVGQFKPNDGGLFDLHGNVNERTNTLPPKVPDDVFRAAIGTGLEIEPIQRVGSQWPGLRARGGCAENEGSGLRVDFGGGSTPDVGNPKTGMRLARSIMRIVPNQ